MGMEIYLDVLMQIISVLFFISFLVFFVTTIFYIMKDPEDGVLKNLFLKSKIGKFSSLTAIVSFLLMFLTGEILNSVVRNEIDRFIVESNDSIQLAVNNDTNPNRELLYDIRNIKAVSNSSRVSCLAKINLRLTSTQNEFLLILKRDKSNTGKYWVYFPKLKTTENNCVGIIYTKMLDKYN